MLAFENNVLMLLFALAMLAGLAGLGFGLWKPIGRRAWNYLRVWWQQDKLAEAEAKRTAEARRAARRELAEACAEDAPEEEAMNEAARAIKADCAPSAPSLPQSSQPRTTAARGVSKISLIRPK